MENSWWGHINGTVVNIYAGQMGYHTGASAGRGVVLVFDPSPASVSYLAPLGVGSLRVVSYQGTLLTVQAATGETFYFDAASRAFTDANGNPVSTDTLTPFPEPTPGGGTLPFPFPTDAPTSAEPSNTAIASLAPVAGG